MPGAFLHLGIFSLNRPGPGPQATSLPSMTIMDRTTLFTFDLVIRSDLRQPTPTD